MAVEGESYRKPEVTIATPDAWIVSPSLVYSLLYSESQDVALIVRQTALGPPPLASSGSHDVSAALTDSDFPTPTRRRNLRYGAIYIGAVPGRGASSRCLDLMSEELRASEYHHASLPDPPVPTYARLTLEHIGRSPFGCR